MTFVMRFWCGVIVALAFVLAPRVAVAGVLHVEDMRFRDDEHGTVILRGVNVAGDAKVPPFRGISDASQLEPLQRFGFNAVRLLFTWEAYEPQRGVYDDAYLAYYVETAKAAAALGLYVIVDFHQDAFSRYALGGCGEGFPAWAIPAGVPQAVPDNGDACKDWGVRMQGNALLDQCWDAFYSDAEGVRSRYLTMIGRVAAALVSEPMVIGYDLLNEPGGDEKTQIPALYEDAARALRAVDPSAIVFVSPGGVTSAGTATELPRPTFSNFVYAPHFYDVALVLFHAWQGNDERDVFDSMMATATAWNVPLFVGEYGAPPDVASVDGYLSAITTQLDRTLASGAQWVYTPNWDLVAKDGWNREDFSIVDLEGATRANFRVRPYARRIGGTPEAIESVEIQGISELYPSFTVTWANESVGDTEIFAPAEWFGGEPDVRASDGVRCVRIGSFVRCNGPLSVRYSVTLSPPWKKCGLTGIEPLLLLGAVAFVRRRRR